jgi:hypothetical protein
MAVGVGTLLASACTRAPADPVRALLSDLAAAAEARDAERFGACLSEGFAGHGQVVNRTEAVATLRRYFAAYESVGVEVYGIEVDRQGASARVRCVVDFSGRARRLPGLDGLLPPSAAYRFDLDVADEGGTWCVRTAAWEPVEAAPPAEGH